MQSDSLAVPMKPRRVSTPDNKKGAPQDAL
jgi:hypothetical protein